MCCSRLKRKVFVVDSFLPTLEWSTRATCLSANGALLFLGVGVASGHYLKIFAPNASPVSFFSDPIALGTTVLFVATVVRRFARARSAAVDEGAEAAFFTIVCSATLAVLLLFVALSGRGHWRDLLDRPAATQPVETAPTSPASEPQTPTPSLDAPEKTEKTPDSAFSGPNVSTKFRQNAPSLLANVASRRQNKDARFFGVRPFGAARLALSISSFPFPQESFSR